MEVPMATDSPSQISALLSENRQYPPPPAFAAEANIDDPAVYDSANEDYLAFWERHAEDLDWFQRWDRVLQWDCPWAKWFVNGKINASYNCLDRHLATKGSKTAIIWEGEPGDQRSLTYEELARQVRIFANGLKSLGLKRGDRVAIYMGMVPELPIALLACARIG